MPTYDYECKKCQYKFEVFQSIKDNPLTNCPQCNGEIKRLIGAGLGIIFKGNGFYTTDYKKSSVSSSTASPAKENKTQSSADGKDSGAPAAKNSTDSAASKESKENKESKPTKEGKSKEALAS